MPLGDREDLIDMAVNRVETGHIQGRLIKSMESAMMMISELFFDEISNGQCLEEISLWMFHVSKKFSISPTMLPLMIIDGNNVSFVLNILS